MPRDPDDDDPLEALRERLEATQEAVERLAAQAARAAQDAGDGATVGGGAADAGVPGAGDADTELRALVALVGALRGLLPTELQVQLTEVIRQLLILVRSILDWSIDRMAPPPAPGGQLDMEDIEVR
jgi:hypothetical protein